MRHFIWRQVRLYCFLAAALLSISACGVAGNSLTPTEEEQIKNVATSYFVRDQSIPQYEAEIEEVVDEWARVSLAPTTVDAAAEPMIMYLQNQTETENPVPTARPLSEPSEDVEVATALGWAIVTKPQAQFTDEELDALGVPEEIRP